MKGKVTFEEPIWEEVSEDAKEFIQKCLTLNPEERPTAEDLLYDPWILGSLSLC